jgi:hypothetical protein
MSGSTESQPPTCFSDESRVIHGTDNQSVWYRGTDNQTAIKFSRCAVIFAVIGLGYKSKPLLVEGTINIDNHIDKLDALHFLLHLIFR